jgi:hypothetical protein
MTTKAITRAEGCDSCSMSAGPAAARIGCKTKYTARVRHWTEADREADEKMGFHTGRAARANVR